MGVVRFTRIGFPHPYFTAHFVGGFEVLCGLLVLLGLWTRLVSIPLLFYSYCALTSAYGIWSVTRAPISPCSAACFFSSQWVAGVGLLMQGARVEEELYELCGLSSIVVAGLVHGAHPNALARTCSQLSGMDFRRLRVIRAVCSSSLRTADAAAARATEVGAGLGGHCHQYNAAGVGHRWPDRRNPGRLRGPQANDDLVGVLIRAIYRANRFEPDVSHASGSPIHYRAGNGQRMEYRRSDGGRNLARSRPAQRGWLVAIGLRMGNAAGGPGLVGHRPDQSSGTSVVAADVCGRRYSRIFHPLHSPCHQ